MSVVVPKNYSPSLLSDRRDASMSGGYDRLKPSRASPDSSAMAQQPAPINFMQSQSGNSGNAMIIQMIVLVVAVVAIIFVIYVLFNPLISSLFGSVLDTVNGITSVTAESLGTITQTLGTVITTATGVVSQVSGVGINTISTLTNVLTNTLETTTNIIVGDGSTDPAGNVNKGILGSFELVLKGISNEIVGTPEIKDSGGNVIQEERTGILPSINTSIVNINNIIIGTQTTDGLLQTISNTARDAIETFTDFIKDIGPVFFGVLNTIRTSMETIVSGIQDCIRYLVEPFLNTSYGIPAIARTLAGVVAQFNDSIKDVSSNIKSGIDSVTDAVNGLTNIFG